MEEEARTAPSGPPLDLLEASFRVSRPATDAPSIFLRLGALMPLATILAPRTFFRFGSQLLRPNLFAVIVAGSSTLRKSEAIRWTRGMLRKVDSSMLLPTAGSVEGLVEALKEKSDGILLFDEFARLLARSRKDFAQDLPQVICELYDGSPIKERKRQGGTTTIEAPVVSLLGATAPEPLLKFLGTQDVHSGLLPRFLIVSAKKSDVPGLIYPPAMNMAERDELADAMKDANCYLSTISQNSLLSWEGQEFTINPDALKAYEELHISLRETFPTEDLMPSVERHGPMALKIACILAYAHRRAFQVEASDVVEAAGWVTGSLEALRSLIESIDAKEAGDKVVYDAERVLKPFLALWPENKSGGVPHRDLLNRSNLAADRAWPALLYLTETGKLLPLFSGLRVRWFLRPQFEPDLQTQIEQDTSIAACADLVRKHIAEQKYGRKGRTP